MPRRPVIDLDADPRNADWTKQSWDLDVHSLEELLAYLNANNMTPEDFKKLPVYELNVDKPDFHWLRQL